MWLTQSVEHATLDFEVVHSSPTLGVDITLKSFKKSNLCDMIDSTQRQFH